MGLQDSNEIKVGILTKLLQRLKSVKKIFDGQWILSHSKPALKVVKLVLMSLSSVIFNTGTMILCIVLLAFTGKREKDGLVINYYVITFPCLIFLANFIVNYCKASYWLSKMENQLGLKFKKKECKYRREVPAVCDFWFQRVIVKCGGS